RSVGGDGPLAPGRDLALAHGGGAARRLRLGHHREGLQAAGAGRLRVHPRLFRRRRFRAVRDGGAGEGPPDPFVLPITGELDLHAFSAREAMAVVGDYLDECRRRGLLEVRIVHGRGRGVRRAEVRRLLAAREDVLEVRDAPPSSGGWGATLVVLAPGSST